MCTAHAAFGERHCNYVRQMRIKVLFEKGLGRGFSQKSRLPNVSYSVTSMGASASQAGRRTESLVRVQRSPFLKESSVSLPD